MFAENSKEQLFQRYNTSVIVVFSSIMLLTFIVTLYSFSTARQAHRDIKLTEMSQYSAQLNNKLTSTVETLTGIRELAEYYLRFPAELPSEMPMLKQEGKNFYLNKNRQNLHTNDRILSGNITGVGRVSNFTESFKRELIMANALTPAFVAAQDSIKEANWLYYISMRRFINLYPWVPRSIWQYTDQSLTNSLMLRIKNSTHKDAKFWSRPYLDSTGKGLNTALGIGVYLAEQMKGAVLIDINTADLYSYLPDVSEEDHGYIIVDKQSNVLLHKNSANLTLNAHTTFSDAAPEQLSQLSYHSLLELEPSAEYLGWVLQRKPLPINDWVLLEYQREESFYAAINKHFLMIFISIFIGLFTLLVVIYYVTHRSFIAPSKNFISHIENCSAGDPGKIKPSEEWQHWFKIVEDLFGENRSLMQRLKDQNSELDLRVKEKTQALFHKSEQHQRDYALLRSVMDAIPDFILFTDQKGCLIGCNEAVEKLIKQTEVDILGTQLTEFIAAEFGESIAQSLIDIERKSPVREHQQTLSTTNKSYEIYKAPFYGENSVLLGNIILLRDVTQQHRINLDLQRAKNQAEEANQIKSQFLANMSHEIRTPINAIQGMFYLLQQSRLDKVQEQYLSNAETASTTLLYLVNELLDSAKVESGNMTIHKELVELDSIIAQALNLNIAALKGKDLALNVAIDSEVPIKIITDTMRLVQVLSNLLNNAIKFTERGKVELSVTLLNQADRLQDAKNITVLFTVKDTGIGVEKAKQAMLFQAFKQADESMTRVYGGTGLGLSICQHIAQLLGGEITIDSVLGEGAEFTLALPVSVQSNSVVVLADDRTTRNTNELPSHDVFNLAVALPEKLRENFADIKQSIIDISSFDEIVRQHSHRQTILLVDSAQYSKGFSPSEVKLIEKNIDLLALCQPISSVISFEFIDQLNQHNINYLLLEMPLYRQVITQLTKALNQKPLNHIKTTTPAKVETLANARESLAGLKVLLVEDNLVNQLVAIKLLESLKVEVIVAQNGQEALDKLPLQDVDIIFMDIQMPVMDGLTATQHIRAQKRYSKLPIIAMTAHAREEDKQQCLEAGMNLHIAKPISLDALRESMQSQLSTNH